MDAASAADPAGNKAALPSLTEKVGPTTKCGFMVGLNSWGRKEERTSLLVSEHNGFHERPTVVGGWARRGRWVTQVPDNSPGVGKASSGCQVR